MYGEESDNENDKNLNCGGEGCGNGCSFAKEDCGEYDCAYSRV